MRDGELKFMLIYKTIIENMKKNEEKYFKEGEIKIDIENIHLIIKICYETKWKKIEENSEKHKK